MSTITADAARTLRVGRARTTVELRNLWRNRDQLGFTIAFPVVVLLLFATIFTGDIEGTGATVSQLYTASIIGSALMSTGFVSLAIGIALEREAGLIDRLAGTPMPRPAYFVGKVGVVLGTVAVQTAAMLALGAALFDLRVPTDPGRWWTFAWVFVLGVTASTLLGIAVGGVIARAESASAIVNLPFVALQFISGVWISIDALPSWLVRISQVFPLHWICRGMRSVFLPDTFATVESGGTWQLGTCSAVLAAWCILGFVLCTRTFRWSRP